MCTDLNPNAIPLINYTHNIGVGSNFAGQQIFSKYATLDCKINSNILASFSDLSNDQENLIYVEFILTLSLFHADHLCSFCHLRSSLYKDVH